MIDEMIEVWGEILPVAAIEPTSDFCKLGGDSLMATNLAALIEERFEVFVDSYEVFENPTPRDLTDHLQAFRSLESRPDSRDRRRCVKLAVRIGHRP